MAFTRSRNLGNLASCLASHSCRLPTSSSRFSIHADPSSIAASRDINVDELECSTNALRGATNNSDLD